MYLPPTTSGKKNTNYRLMDDVEPIERKRMKLDNYSRKRWSLSDKRDHPEVLADMGVSMLDEENSKDETQSTSKGLQPTITNYFQKTTPKLTFKKQSPLKKSPFNVIGNSLNSSMSENQDAQENDYDTLNVTNPQMICPDILDKVGDIENRRPKSKRLDSPTTSNKKLARRDSDKSELGYTDSEQPSDKTTMSNLVIRSPLSSINNKNELRSNSISLLRIPNDEFYIYKRRKPCVTAGQDVFSKLSDEVILSIFKWLPKKTLIRCSLVCNRWRRVCHDESLWSRLDLGGKTLRSGAISRILSRGPIILRLAQAEIEEPALIPTCVASSEKYRCKLQYLDLSMCVVSGNTLADIFLRCESLKKLSLEHVAVNDNVCKYIAQNKELEALNLSMCEGMTLDGIKNLLIGCEMLQSLNISWTRMEDDAMKYFVRHAPASLIRLNIAGNRKTLSDDLVQELISRCPDLIELDLSDCTLLTAATITNLEALKNLEYLSLSRCYSIQAPAYLVLQRFHCLLYLDIFGLMSEQAIEMLQNQLPQVRINKFLHSSVARPTVGNRRTSIWGLRTRD